MTRRGWMSFLMVLLTAGHPDVGTVAAAAVAKAISLGCCLT
jgi:hypothetical protein